ncbi:MAG: hypothetical protein WD208_08520 [Dehalococcoidia bacterium]
MKHLTFFLIVLLMFAVTSCDTGSSSSVEVEGVITSIAVTEDFESSQTVVAGTSQGQIVIVDGDAAQLEVLATLDGLEHVTSVAGKSVTGLAIDDGTIFAASLAGLKTVDMDSGMVRDLSFPGAYIPLYVRLAPDFQQSNQMFAVGVQDGRPQQSLWQSADGGQSWTAADYDTQQDPDLLYPPVYSLDTKPLLPAHEQVFAKEPDDAVWQSSLDDVDAEVGYAVPLPNYLDTGTFLSVDMLGIRPATLYHNQATPVDLPFVTARFGTGCRISGYGGACVTPVKFVQQDNGSFATYAVGQVWSSDDAEFLGHSLFVVAEDGQSWEQSQRLMNHEIVDLLTVPYDDTTAVIMAGDRSVYVSLDNGANWQTISYEEPDQ